MISTIRHCVHPQTLDTPSAKPRMVYFRWPLTSYPPFNQRLFERLFVTGLSEWFDLVIVENDCDYGEICDLHQPDLTLFESGNNNYAGPYTSISNTSSHPAIPKLGFMRADPMCPSRTTFYAEMERWGIDTWFTYVSNAGDYLPEIADNLFYWPFAVDATIYRDYGQQKLLPILFMGNTDIAQYAWRKRIRAAVSEHFQTVVVPHVGYSPKYSSQALFDEPYSRLINSAYITPTCGGMVKALVNKHLEIPASASLLLTEETPILREFGFRHMENCVFADEGDVRDVVDHLFRHPDEMQRITRNGFDLVHSHHTIQQRPQILQWYQLHKQMQPGQRIVQSTMCGDLRIVAEHAPDQQVHIDSASTDRALLRTAWHAVDRGEFASAMEQFAQCVAYTPYMAEPRLGFATCLLHTGKPNDALFFLKASIEMILTHGGREPDPIEWAMWLITLLALGRVDEAVSHAATFPDMHRAELEWARWAVFTAAGLTDAASAALALADDLEAPRRSIHARGTRTFHEALDEMNAMFIACGRQDLVSTLDAAITARA